MRTFPTLRKGVAAAIMTVAVTGALMTAAAWAKPSGTELPSGRALMDSAMNTGCLPAPAHQFLREYQAEIASAPTVEEARGLVLGQTGLARRVLAGAGWLMPFSSSVDQAQHELDDLETRVYAAASQDDVAREFGDFMHLPASANGDEAIILAGVQLDKKVVDVDTNGGGCEYTTGEIVLIVLGFIFFIIPGIIFLIIFC